MTFFGPHARTLEEIQDRKILVIGDLIIDETWEVERKEGFDGDPRLNVISRWRDPGGAGRVAEMIHRLGCDVTLLTHAQDPDEIDHRAKWELVRGDDENDIVIRTQFDDETPFQRFDVAGTRATDFSDLSRFPQPEWFDQFTTIVYADYGRGLIHEPLARRIRERIVEQNQAHDESKMVVAAPHDGSFLKYAENVQLGVVNRKNIKIAEPSPGMCITHQGAGDIILAIGRGLALIQASRPYFGCRPTYGAGDQLLAAIAATLYSSRANGNTPESITVPDGVRPLTAFSSFWADCAHLRLTHGNVYPETIERLSADQRTILTSGCFDLPHPGHLKVLEHAAALAAARRAKLIVAVNSDDSIKRIKGREAYLKYAERAAFVQDFLDRFLHQNANDPYELARVMMLTDDTPVRLAAEFDVKTIIKGSDWAKLEIPEAEGREILFIDRNDQWASSRMAAACQPAE